MSLKKEDLIQTCPACKGKGKISDTPQKTQNSSFGTSAGFSSWHSCSRCRQTGQIITEEGEAIVSLINLAKRHGKI